MLCSDSDLSNPPDDLADSFPECDSRSRGLDGDTGYMADNSAMSMPDHYGGNDSFDEDNGDMVEKMAGMKEESESEGYQASNGDASDSDFSP